MFIVLLHRLGAATKSTVPAVNAVIVQVRAVTPKDRVDMNGWPSDFFERVAGSMPDLQRPSQGNFEDRIAFE